MIKIVINRWDFQESKKFQSKIDRRYEITKKSYRTGNFRNLLLITSET